MIEICDDASISVCRCISQGYAHLTIGVYLAHDKSNIHFIRRSAQCVNILYITLHICDRILENSFKSHMKSSVFLHVFNDITYVRVFTEYFLHSFSNLSIEFLVVL